MKKDEIQNSLKNHLEMLAGAHQVIDCAEIDEDGHIKTECEQCFNNAVECIQTNTQMFNHYINNNLFKQTGQIKDN